MKEVFERWANAINTVEQSIKKANYGYAYTEHLGYITTCPSNCGTGLRASVMLKLPKVYLIKYTKLPNPTQPYRI